MKKNKKLIAMLGGGQLGLMFTQKAKLMGEKVLILDPDKNCPAGKIADKFINSEYLDKEALQLIKDSCDSCTIEFENIPYKTLQILEKKIKVFPNSNAVKILQNRIFEKNFLKKENLPTTTFYEINSTNDLNLLLNINDWPYIIKTSTFGYDGKGQTIVNNFKELRLACQNLNSQSFVLEKKITLKKEVSQIAACYKNKIIFLPISENIHVNNILHKSLVPANITLESENAIKKITKDIINKLKYEGVLCVEFFIDNNDNILVNEIAPRTHNSGHYSIEGCNISQFEHQVKILLNHAPENSILLSPVVMINLLGDLWKNREPNFKLIDTENAFLHLYNKNEAKSGRKMGHFTIKNSSLNLAKKISDNIFNKLNEK